MIRVKNASCFGVELTKQVCGKRKGIRNLNTVVLTFIIGVYKCAPVNEIIITHFWQILYINLKRSLHSNCIVHILKSPS